MKKTVKAIGLFCSLVCALAASAQVGYVTPFLEDISLSNRRGKPASPKTGYLPAVVGYDTLLYVEIDGNKKLIDELYLSLYIKEFGNEQLKDSIQKHVIGPPDQIWYSRYLYEFEEPVLHNFYLEKEIIRFTLIRSFHQPLLVKAEKEGARFYLVFKLLKNRLYESCFVDAMNQKELTSFYEEQTDLEACDTIFITEKEFGELDMLMQNTGIKNEPPKLNYGIGDDGAEWILEWHSKAGYYYQCRWSPDKTSSIYQIGKRLISWSKKEVELY